MATYRLQFVPPAKLEWDKLDGSIRAQFAKVLLRRLEQPRVPSAALTAMPDCYKIKLRSTGFRLVYRVHEDTLILMTIAVGKRDRSAVYDTAKLRLALDQPPQSASAAKSTSKRPKSH